MRTLPFALAAAALVVAAAAGAKEEDPLPPPPTTPLPTFENPLHDAKPGETLRYRVMELESQDLRYYEERVLARKDDRVLLETVETDETGTKVFSIDPQRSGWRAAPASFKLPDDQSWKKEKQKEVLVGVGPVGKPPTKSVRCTLRYLDEPEIPSDPKGRRRERRIWYSHDVPCSGKAKEWPAQNEGERLVISWDRVLSPEECAERAKKYRDREEEERKKKEEEEAKKKAGPPAGDAPKPEGGGEAKPEGGDAKPDGGDATPEGAPAPKPEGETPREPEGGGKPPG
jgi:hypothetical protein